MKLNVNLVYISIKTTSQLKNFKVNNVILFYGINVKEPRCTTSQQSVPIC